MNGPDDQQPVTDDSPTLDLEILDDLDPKDDTADPQGGNARTCEGCTRTCASYS